MSMEMLIVALATIDQEEQAKRAAEQQANERLYGQGSKS